MFADKIYTIFSHFSHLLCIYNQSVYMGIVQYTQKYSQSVHMGIVLYIQNKVGIVQYIFTGH